MDALDLSMYTLAVDSQELREYKAKVKKVADKYAKQHGWCNQVNKALLEVGIGAVTKVKVAVTVYNVFDLVVTVDLEEVWGKTVGEQLSAIGEKLGGLTLAGNASVAFPTPALSFTSADITAMSTIAPDAKATNAVSELTAVELADLNWLYTSIEGRVRHCYAAPRGYVGLSRYRASSCGRGDTYTVERASYRASNPTVLCQKCVQRVGAPTIQTEATA